MFNADDANICIIMLYYYANDVNADNILQIWYIMSGAFFGFEKNCYIILIRILYEIWMMVGLQTQIPLDHQFLNYRTFRSSRLACNPSGSARDLLPPLYNSFNSSRSSILLNSSRSSKNMQTRWGHLFFCAGRCWVSSPLTLKSFHGLYSQNIIFLSTLLFCIWEFWLCRKKSNSIPYNYMTKHIFGYKEIEIQLQLPIIILWNRRFKTFDWGCVRWLAVKMVSWYGSHVWVPLYTYGSLNAC